MSKRRARRAGSPRSGMEAGRWPASWRKRRSARTFVSSVEEIPGIGTKRRQALLRRFGSVERIRAARAEEIAEVPGFSLRMGERVLEHLAQTGAAVSADSSIVPPGPGEAGIDDGGVSEPVFNGMGRQL